MLCEADALDLDGDWPERTFWTPWIDEGVHVSYTTFVRRVIEAARGYRLRRIASECNGVGAMPSAELKRLAPDSGRIVEVNTTSESKANGFGALKVMLSQGRLALPRNPPLLAQLSALEYEQRDSGTAKIAVPERQGHDDIALALMLAVSESDVTLKPSMATFHVPVGEIPKAVLDRQAYAPPNEPAVEVVKQGQSRPSDRLRQFNVARRHPNYQRPGPGSDAQRGKDRASGRAVRPSARLALLFSAQRAGRRVAEGQTVTVEDVKAELEHFRAERDRKATRADLIRRAEQVDREASRLRAMAALRSREDLRFRGPRTSVSEAVRGTFLFQHQGSGRPWPRHPSRTTPPLSGP